MFEFLTELSSSPWTYAIVFAFAALDSLVPVVPSETAAIAAGVLAASGDLNIALVIAAAGTGAFIGDNSAYNVGRRLGPQATRVLFRGKKGPSRLAWATRTLDARGGYLIVVARFIPGGRTAATLTAGLTAMTLGRFVRAAALAALLWASFAAGIGYLGGHTFEDEPWRALVFALALASAITLGVEAVRFLRTRVRRTQLTPCADC